MRSSEHEQPDNPYAEMIGVPASASLWVVLPKLAIGVVTSTVVLIALFWLQFGHFSTYSLLAAAFAAGFQILVVVGLRHQAAFNEATVRPNRVLDLIGAFWLVFVVFGSFFGWFSARLPEIIPSFATALHVLTVMLTIVLPILTSIPNYRYVTQGNAYITLPMFLIVSLLPSLIGYSSLIELWRTFNS